MEYGSSFKEGIRIKMNVTVEVDLSREELLEGGQKVYGLMDERLGRALEVQGREVFRAMGRAVEEKLLRGSEGIRKHAKREVTLHLKSCGKVKTTCWQVSGQDAEGKKRYFMMLKDYLGLKGSERMSPILTRDLVRAGASQPYRGAGEREGVSHTTVWKTTQTYGSALEAMEQEALAACVGGGQEVDFLGVEPDGFWVRQQRGNRKSMEIKGILTFRGREPRYQESEAAGAMKLTGKRMFAGIYDAETFLDLGTRDMENQYTELWKTLMLVVSDGADWIKRVREYYPKSYHQLDRLHAEQVVTRGTASCKALRKEVREALWKKQDVNKALEQIAQEKARLERCRGRIAKESEMERLVKKMDRAITQVKELATYLTNHREILFTVEQSQTFSVREKILGSGGIERNLETVFGHRMKGDGKSWTKSGAQHMIKVLCSLANGTFEQDCDVIERERHGWVKTAEATLAASPIKRLDTVETRYYEAFQRMIPRNTTTSTGRLLEEIVQGNALANV